MLEIAIASGFRIVLALTFGLAALSKARRLSDFSSSLVSYGIPARASFIFALVVVGTELAVAVGLAIQLSPVSELAAILLLLTLTIAVALRWQHEGSFDCGCFGAPVPTTRRWLVFPRNVALMLLTYVALRVPPATAWSVLPSALVTAVTLVIAAVLLTQLSQLETAEA